MARTLRLILLPALLALVIAASVTACGSSSSSSPPSAPAQSPAAAPAAPGAPSSGATKSGTVAVTIKNFAFTPQHLNVKVGTKVTWTNDDTAPHTATQTSGPAKFDSGILNQGQSYSYTFTTPGTYHYYCTVHNYMTATVTVS